MIVHLQIEKIAPGVYRGHCDGEPSKSPTYSSIADCLRFYGEEIPPEFAQFINIGYAGCQLDTVAIAELTAAADGLAGRLMDLVANTYTVGIPKPS